MATYVPSLFEIVKRSSSKQVPVPETCTKITPECPVEGTLYGYAPNIGANAFFTGFFAICMIWHIILGIRYKTWTYMIALVFGCLGEAVGYAGRVLLWNNPYDDLGFQIQICCLIIAPAFISAGIYLTLKHIVLNFGRGWSRLRPAWYTWTFIAADLLSLILQGAGGGLAAGADPGSSSQDLGTNLMIAGVIWQVVCLSFFGYFLAEYGFRTRRHYNELRPTAISLLRSRLFQLFIGSIVIAFLTIFVRCVYRIPELTGGWGSELMRNELDFVILEGAMIVIAVLVLSIFHPGYCFPVMGSMSAHEKKKALGKSLGKDDSSTETISQV